MERKTLECDPAAYHLEAIVGKGAFASVFRARYVPTGERVAVKVIALTGSGAQDDELLFREVSIMTSISPEEPALLPCYAAFVVRDTLWIVTPMMELGSCGRLVRLGAASGGVGLDERWAACILRCVVSGLCGMHSKGHMHRDVKAANVLLDLELGCLLGDFGVASVASRPPPSGAEARAATLVGTPCWMAPEVLEEGPCGYNAKADVWSLGITAIELVAGRAPFADLEPSEGVVRVLTGEPPTLQDANPALKPSSAFASFLRKCLRRNPRNRKSAKELLSHRFLKSAPPFPKFKEAVLQHVPPVHGISIKPQTLKKLRTEREMSTSSPTDDPALLPTPEPGYGPLVAALAGVDESRAAGGGGEEVVLGGGGRGGTGVTLRVLGMGEGSAMAVMAARCVEESVGLSAPGDADKEWFEGHRTRKELGEESEGGGGSGGGGVVGDEMGPSIEPASGTTWIFPDEVIEAVRHGTLTNPPKDFAGVEEEEGEGSEGDGGGGGGLLDELEGIGEMEDGAGGGGGGDLGRSHKKLATRKEDKKDVGMVEELEHIIGELGGESVGGGGRSGGGGGMEEIGLGSPAATRKEKKAVEAVVTEKTGEMEEDEDDEVAATPKPGKEPRKRTSLGIGEFERTLSETVGGERGKGGGVGVGGVGGGVGGGGSLGGSGSELGSEGGWEEGGDVAGGEDDEEGEGESVERLASKKKKKKTQDAL